ncbi:hypothetical protein K431DRAFT_307220 [Polychaeton citri CBS 116435]|uniref:PRISE-like Rossmann-fold domain-containing protein n=1 Tax=Polychaeton citri CBS 116435 TaxID=1314669 RepID=A0A9P4PY46_9PEZI|nr:hypothetical protein K431DRAFT_307220 [Polychaeton citri CBS 116435]
MANHVLVFGASGSAGWSVVEEALARYPNHDTFSTVTAMVNRPLSLSASGWTNGAVPGRPSLRIASGIDLTAGTAETLAATMKGQAPELNKTTHVIYCAFIQHDHPATEARMNGEAMQRLTGALNLECPDLRKFVLSEGTRFYHRQCSAENALPAPFKEEMTRWCNEQQREELFYFHMEAALDETCKGGGWTWCGIIPDAVIGFAPSGSTFALQLMWATWLALYRHNNGAGAKVHYPGTGTSYSTKFNEVSASVLAKGFIWAALNPDIQNGEIFNIADRHQPSTMADTFPKLCGYFGLESEGPPETLDETSDFVMPSKYVKDNRHRFEEMGLTPIRIWKGDWLDAYGTMYTYDRHIGLDKIRAAGFVEERDPLGGWFKAFEQMKTANMIPW